MSSNILYALEAPSMLDEEIEMSTKKLLLTIAKRTELCEEKTLRRAKQIYSWLLKKTCAMVSNGDTYAAVELRRSNIKIMDSEMERIIDYISKELTKIKIENESSVELGQIYISW